MKLAELIVELEHLAREAAATESVAPTAKIYRHLLSKLSRVDGLGMAGHWLDTAEAADVFGVSDKTIRRWCSDGRFPNARKTSGDTGEWRIPAAEVYRDSTHEEGGSETIPRLWRENNG